MSLSISWKAPYGFSNDLSFMTDEDWRVYEQRRKEREADAVNRGHGGTEGEERESAAKDIGRRVMTQEDRDKVIGHALDHIAYQWAKGLPVRHDRREWTEEELQLYNETYDREYQKRKAQPHAKGRLS